jgi:hypothetical protein
MICTARLGAGGDSAVAARTPAPPPAAAAPPPPPPPRVELSNEYTATVSVVSVDKEHRVLTLRREDGSLFAVNVGPDARNFDKIAAGNNVRVRYRESLAAELRPKSEGSKPVEAAIGAARAKAGARPAGAVGMAISARVKIEALDLAHDIVVFSLPSGELSAHRLKTAEGRAFAKGLAIGDMVQLDCDVAVALSVDEI